MRNATLVPLFHVLFYQTMNSSELTLRQGVLIDAVRLLPNFNATPHLNVTSQVAAPSDANDANTGVGVNHASIVCLSLLFCVIGVVGVVGNLLVIYVIVSDKKMRKSVTNLFIMNLALFDLLIMLFGVPEIVQFMLDRGWLLGLVPCKLHRYVLVFSLYASVLTLVAVCVER